MSRSAMLQQYANAKANADRDFVVVSEILANLPGDVELVRLDSHGNIADATLFVTGSLRALAKALPPVEVAFVDNGYTARFNPAEVVEAKPGQMLEPVFPIQVVNRGNSPGYLRWWSPIGTRRVEVSAPYSPGAVMDLMGDAKDSWAPAAQKYMEGTTHYWRKRQRLSTDLNQVSPLDRWTAQRDAWGTAHDYNAAKTWWLRSLVQFGLKYVQPPAGPNQDPAWMRFGGDFWTKFSESEAAALKHFAQEHLAQCSAIVAETERAIETAKVWFLAFFGSRGDPRKVDLDVLRYKFHSETGLAGKINWAQAAGPGEVLEVAYMLDKANLRMTCPAKEGEPIIDWMALREYY